MSSSTFPNYQVYMASGAWSRLRNTMCHLRGTKRSSHKIQSTAVVVVVMKWLLLWTKCLLDMLDPSGSEIEEDPGFLIPHGSDSECEEPL